MTVNELSKQLGITPRAITGIIQKLGLSPQKYGTTFVLSKKEINAVKNNYHPKAGQPKKVKNEM